MKTHGMSGTKLYTTWANMKARCYNARHVQYNDYGGRGIAVCEEWKADFMAFYTWSMANGYSEELELDRIDNNRGYSPDNCRYTTHKVNNLNKRNTIKTMINGELKTVEEIAEITSEAKTTIRNRIYVGNDPLKRGRDVEMLTVGGITKTVIQWSKDTGISDVVIRRRIRRGLTGEAVIKPNPAKLMYSELSRKIF